MTETIYVNGFRIKETQYSLKVGIKADDVIDFINQHKNDAGYVNIEIKKRKAPSQYGETHYAVLDTWKPTGQQQGQPSQQSQAPTPPPPPVDDLPF